MNNRLKEFRKTKNITQVKLASYLNVTNDYISAIERGRRTPGFELARKIADYFNVKIDDIFFEN